MIKRFIIAIVLLALVCGGIVGFNLFRANAIKQFFATRKQPAQAVSTVTVKAQTWQPGLDAIGTVSARRGVDVSVETSGTVTKVNFQANQMVKKGDVLVQLDDEVERADLASSKSALQLAQENLKRTRKLASQGISATSSLQSSQSEATQAQSSVKKLQAVLDQKQLKAPFTGTIGIPKIDIGQYLTTGTAVATLQALDTMRVDFTLPESDFPRLHLDQTVHVGFTDGKMPFTGKLTGINPKIDPQSRLVSVRGEIGNSDRKLQPGQFVHVEVELPAQNNVLALPQTAVVTSLYGDYVFVVRHASEAKQNSGDAASGGAKAAKKTDATQDGAPSAETGAGKDDDLIAKQVFVTLGDRRGSEVAITKGIKPGDVVVDAGQNRLTSGGAVTIDNSLQPTATGDAGDGQEAKL